MPATSFLAVCFPNMKHSYAERQHGGTLTSEAFLPLSGQPETDTTAPNILDFIFAPLYQTKKFIQNCGALCQYGINTMLFLNFISHPKNGLDVGGVLGVRFQFVPQAPNRVVHSVGARFIVLTPGRIVELFPAEYTSRAAGHAVKDRELSVVQADFLTGLCDPPLLWEYLNISQSQGRRLKVSSMENLNIFSL